MKRENVRHLIETMQIAARFEGHFSMRWWFSSGASGSAARPGRFPTTPPTLHDLMHGNGTRACLAGWEASTEYARLRGFGWAPLPAAPLSATPRPVEWAPGGADTAARLARYLGIPEVVAEALSGTPWAAPDGRPNPWFEISFSRHIPEPREVRAADTILWLETLLALGADGYLAWHEGGGGAA